MSIVTPPFYRKRLLDCSVMERSHWSEFRYSIKNRWNQKMICSKIRSQPSYHDYETHRRRFYRKQLKLTPLSQHVDKLSFRRQDAFKIQN